MEKVLRTTGLLRVARCKAWKEKSRARCKAFPCNFPRLRREVASDPRAWEWLCGPRCVPWVGEERQGPATEVSSIHAVVTSLIATALGSGYYCPHLINGSSDAEMFIDVPGALKLHPGPYSSLISWSSRTSGLTFSPGSLQGCTLSQALHAIRMQTSKPRLRSLSAHPHS